MRFYVDESYEQQLIDFEIKDSQILAIKKAFLELNDRQKEALFLRFNSGLGCHEIAEIMQINYQSARNLIHRSILKLRESYSKNNIVLLCLFKLLKNN